MFIEKIVAGLWETNAYLVASSSEAIIIDPGHESAEALLDIAEEMGLKIKAIYLTHSHFDHFADVDVLQRAIDVPVYVSKEDADNLRYPGSDGLPNVFEKGGLEPDGFFQDGEERKVGDLSFKIIATPGHSPGSVCFYFEKEKVLFSGDTLFRSGHGNTSFPTSDRQKMTLSLKQLMSLPSDTVVYPGHGERTTIGEERKWCA